MEANDKKPTKEEILAKHGYKCAIDVKDKDKFIEAFVNPLLEAMQEYAEQFHKEKMREELINYDEWFWNEDVWYNSHEELIDEYLKTLNTK